MQEFVSYGDKSSARRGTERKLKAAKIESPVDDYLTQVNGKWGFWAEDGVPSAKSGTLSRGVQDAVADEPKTGVLSDMHGGKSTDAPPPSDMTEEPDSEPEDEDDHTHSNSPSASAFSGFAFSQLTAQPQTSTESTRSQTITKIERNRPEANGVKRPSAGTVCDQVWQIATELSNGDEKPSTRIATLSEVVKASEAKGINKFTARTQYARWRVFHGITGRLSDK
jgi:hypothetical protein